MNQILLTINAGSSSIKFALFPRTNPIPQQAILSGQIDGIGTPEAKLVAKNEQGEKIASEALPVTSPDHQQAFDYLLNWLSARTQGQTIAAVGHRVVHGGELYAQPIVLDDGTLQQLEAFIPLAPLHQPHNLAGIRAIESLLPDVLQVACFDTAFHRTQPAVAQLFGLPRRITAEGVRRYGFHGLSYEFIARSLPQYTAHAQGRVVVAHLGNGASMTAMFQGKSVASTMGFTAVDGLMMGTRTGNLDPGVMLYLMDQKGMGSKELTNLLYKESGLLGVSGLSQDMRTLLASDQPEAQEAIDLFCYRIVRELGSLAAAAGGLDALVFTGGIGEHANEVRRRVCEQASWLGLSLSTEANLQHAGKISAPDSSVDILVIPTNEEWMIAHHTQALLSL